MTSTKKINILIVIVAALSGIGFSYIDDTFFDAENSLLVRAFFGGLFFALFLSYFLDTNKKQPAQIDFDESVFNLTKPYNAIFILGAALIATGVVSLIGNTFQGKQLLSSGFIFIIGVSFVLASWGYVRLSKSRETKKG